MKKKEISVVIVDLDNTLYDWFHFWHASFTAMLRHIVADSGIPEEQLLPEIKAVHQRHGTAEYAFLLQEIPSLIQKHPGGDLKTIYNEAIHQYRKARKETLGPYPGVLATLQTLKEFGCLIVGYTESMEFYTSDRIRRLGLDGLIDYLYSPPDHALPDNVKPEDLRMLAPEHYVLKMTVHRTLPRGERKPNPKVLLDIIAEVGASVESAIYVGDSLTRDVLMAQQAHVTDVWAKYGVSSQKEQYDLLRAVTFWTEEEVEKEKKLKEEDIKPTYVLENSFAELLTLFKFPVQERVSTIVQIWEKIIDVQMHFNDLEMRIRNYAISVLVAVLGATAFGLKEHLEIVLFGKAMTVAIPLLVAGIVGWLAFYFMDRFWYHRLLYGAVMHGAAIEKNNKILIPELSLTDAISVASPIVLKEKGKWGAWQIRSNQKIDFFYATILVVLIVIATALYRTYQPLSAAQPSQGSQTQIQSPRNP